MPSSRSTKKALRQQNKILSLCSRSTRQQCVPGTAIAIIMPLILYARTANFTLRTHTFIAFLNPQTVNLCIYKLLSYFWVKTNALRQNSTFRGKKFYEQLITHSNSFTTFITSAHQLIIMTVLFRIEAARIRKRDDVASQRLNKARIDEHSIAIVNNRKTKSLPNKLELHSVDRIRLSMANKPQHADPEHPGSGGI